MDIKRNFNAEFTKLDKSMKYVFNSKVTLLVPLTMFVLYTPSLEPPFFNKVLAIQVQYYIIGEPLSA
jgi:hypothetical protein